MQPDGPAAEQRPGVAQVAFGTGTWGPSAVLTVLGGRLGGGQFRCALLPAGR